MKITLNIVYLHNMASYCFTLIVLIIFQTNKDTSECFFISTYKCSDINIIQQANY